MMGNEACTTLFGTSPSQEISQTDIIADVVAKFESRRASFRVFFVYGPREYGKTMFLSRISNAFAGKDDWIVIDVNPGVNMLESLAFQLYDECNAEHLFANAEVNLSRNENAFLLEGEHVASVDTVLEIMLTELRKQKKKVLITVDGVTNNSYMRVFAHAFQRFLREDFLVYLLMSGLYNDIHNLERAKTMTFLARAPRIELGPL